MISVLLYLLVAFLPVLLYIIIIWVTTPWKSIKFGTALQYLFTGLISVGIILTYFNLFPHGQDPIFINNPSLSIFLYCFLQIALIEELCKLSAFSIADRVRKEERNYDSPIGTMFYCGISALGFAFLENVNYAINYGGDVIFIRSFVAMMIHFLCGLIMGYWIASSRLPSKLENRSIFDVIGYHRPMFKKVIYYIVGVLCASALHGIYDFNIFNGGDQTVGYIIIFGGVISAYPRGSKKFNRKVKDLNFM